MAGRPSDYHYKRPKWMDEGACHTPEGTLTPLFYVTDREEQHRVIRRYCENCPVRQACLEYALEGASSATDHGIWGATTPRMRKSMRRERARMSA